MPNGLFTLKQQVLAIREGGWPGQPPTSVNYLVVAGGGSGGGYAQGAGSSAGGGAGGLLQGNIGITPGSSITVTVGAGGAAPASAFPSPSGNSGNNSVFGSIAATGGGYGGSDNYGSTNSGASGGSGGGAGWGNTTLRSGSAGIAGQGNAGGSGGTGATEYSAGGGGGAGTVGGSPVNAGPAGRGGTGVASDISGTRTTYAGGGGGGAQTNAGAGGAGGGGAGSTSGSGTSGTVNTGGGGGGVGNAASPTTPGAGGSGIVILSYPDIYAAAASTTGSPTVSTSGSGSLFFNGTGQYMTVPSSSQFIASGNGFTIEAWVYYTSITNFSFIVASSTGANAYNPYWFIGSTNTGNWRISWGDATAVDTGVAISLNTWNHVAISMASNGTGTFYVNGVSRATATGKTLNGSNTGIAISHGGGDLGAQYLITGYVSNIRYVKNSSIYTGAFTPPTAPLTAVTGTAFLLSTVSGSQFADSSSNAFVSTVAGTPTWNALSPFATGLGYKNRVYTWTSSGSITF